MKIRIKDIKANPFRDIARYPINQDKVAALRKSIQKTGFWDNVVARKVNGSVELAYGHHRLVALKEEYDENHEVDLIVRDLPDEDMIRIMANENMEEWSNNASVTIETIRAVIQAFAQDRISLPLPGNKVPTVGLRIAPSFLLRKNHKMSPLERRHLYTSFSLIDFLGWHPTAIGRALNVLGTIELKIAKDSDFERVPLPTAETVCTVARKSLEQYGDAKLARSIVKEMCNLTREGKVNLHTAKDTAQKMIADKKGVPLPDIEKFAERISGELHNYLAPEKQLHNKLKDLFKSAQHLPEQNIDDLVDSLDRLSRDAAEWADKFRRYQTVVPLKEIS